jgi:purine nucleosidase
MHKVIFDTDPGIDDAMALLFLERHPDIDLIGVTTVFGNASIETTTRNALFLKQKWNMTAPVAKGANRTIKPERFDDHWPTMIHGDDGLGNINIPADFTGQTDPRLAHRFIIDQVRANPGEITLIAVGRMTNLALALQEDPQIVNLVKEVIVMGGAFDVHGNITPAAEANIHGDPEAADLVFTAAWPVVLVGLDVTMQTAISRELMNDMASRGGADVELLRDISSLYIDFYQSKTGGGMVVHDSCACVYLVAPDVFKTRLGAVRVICGGVADGKTIQKPAGVPFPSNSWDGYPEQKVCVAIDVKRTLDILDAAIVRGERL